MIVAHASLRDGVVARDTVLEGCADLAAGLRQRVTLFEAVLHDLLGPCSIQRLGLIPAALLANHPALRAGAAPGRLQHYAVELVLCPDGVWRVRAGRTACAENPGAAGLFEAPALSPFLPGLCRIILGEALRLPSTPTLWLGELASRTLWARDKRRWLLHHGFERPNRAPGGDTLAQRLAWQRELDSASWALTASHAWCWSDLAGDLDRAVPSAGGRC